jgi:hypothetical protein
MLSNMIFEGLHNLESRIKSQSGKEELKQCVKFAQKEYEKLEKKIHSLQSEKDSLEQTVKYFIESAMPRPGDGGGTLTILSSNGKSIKVDRKLAISASPHIKMVMEMNVNTNIVPLKEYGEIVIKTVVILLQLGEQHSGLMDLRKMDSSEAYNLMELCSCLDIPWACMKVAKDIDKITTLDAWFLTSAQRQLDTCLEPFQSAWKLVCEKATRNIVLNIEQHSLLPDFSKLPIRHLEELTRAVKDEEWPAQLTEDRSDSFKLRVECVGNKVHVHVAIASECKTALCFAEDKVADFRVMIIAKPNVKAYVSGRVPHQSEELTACIASQIVVENIFGDAQTQAEFAHGPDGKTFTISFKAAMTSIHRQCFALINYVRHSKGLGCGRAAVDDCGMLLLALQHFHDRGCGYAVSLLSSYAAKSFSWVRPCAGLLALSPLLVAGIISRDDLATDKDESAVLGLVVRYAMSIPAVPPTGVLPADCASARFETLVRHVRFPYVPTAAIVARLSPEELAFVGRHPSYLALLTEAVGVQQGAQPAPDAEGAQRAAKRVRYGAMPPADLAAILEGAHRAPAPPRPQLP